MKNVITPLVLGLMVLGSPILNAEPSHHHDHGQAHEELGAPKGGRWLDSGSPRAEFFLEKDKTVTITFYDAALNPVPAAAQSIVVMTEEQGVKKRIEFEKKGNVLVSTEALSTEPAPDIVVLFKETPEGKPRNFRFSLNTAICEDCHLAEYACTCGH